MRIAFVTDTYEDGISGGTVSAVRFVEALRWRHDVTVVATGSPAPGKVLVPGFQLPLRAMKENHITFGWPARAILEEVFASVDVVHLNFPFLLGMVAVRTARRMQVPCVAAFHVQPENLLLNINMEYPWLTRWLYRRWVNGFFQRADAVVCPSEFAAERLRSYGLSVPTWVVSNGVPARRPRVTVRTPPRRGGTRVLLSVGRLAREKRQDVIIDAVARSRHRDRIRLVLAGAGPLEQSLRARAQRLGLPVEFGYVSDERLAQLFGEAHLFVHASEVELEGMAVLEAMAAGLPILVADAPDSAARCFASGPEFRFHPGDSADLAAHLDRLLDSPAALLEGSRRSLERAAQHDFQHAAHELERVYEAVVGVGRIRAARGSGAEAGAA